MTGVPAIGPGDAYELGRSIIPTNLDKRPAVKEWKPFQTARPTPDQIQSWAKTGPAGWAQITGAVSNIVTLDFDGPAGSETLRKLGLNPHRKTPSGGYHVDFEYPGWRVKTLNHESAPELGRRWPGLDIRGDGGYVVFAGRSDKGSYEWLRSPDPDPLSILPEDLRRDFGLLHPPGSSNGYSKPQAATKAAINGRVDDDLLVRRAVEKARSEGRNNAGFWLAAQLRDNGYSQFEADSIIMRYVGLVPATNLKGQHEPYTAAEARASLREAYSQPARDAWPRRQHDGRDRVQAERTERAAQHSAGTDLWSFPLTDLGNAERMVLLHGRDIRFCHQWAKWLVWNGRRWVFDASAEVMRRAQATVRKMFEKAGRIEDSKLREDAWKHARQSEKHSRLIAMVALAATLEGIAIVPETTDADPWLLNVENGTIDLRTGELSQHRREDLLTKLAPVRYDPDDPCPVWESFQRRIMGGDLELIATKQRAVGYALTGNAIEKRSLFIYRGDGNNGKTTELELYRHMLGDYAGQVRIEALMEQARASGTAPSPDIADLRGLRLVVSSEPSEGQRLSESTIKYLTSMGTIKARHLHKEHFEFKQTWTFFMDCNHKPEIRGTDSAIWNRIGLIPFDVVIPDEEIDRALPQKLRAEVSGILAWAVRGCLDWQRHGLKVAAAAQVATASYRAEMDGIGRFLGECCLVMPNASARGRNLYSAYAKWCEESGERPISQKVFGLQLSVRPAISKVHDEKGVRYDGVGLREDRY
jgi:putative DNA primase/helicase